MSSKGDVSLPRAKYIVRRVKAFLILALAALAIYQTSQLWFVNLANRSLFLYISARLPAAASDGYRAFVRPMRLIYGAGDGRFDIRYSGLMDMPPRSYFDTVLTELFVRGTLESRSETDYERILSRPVLVFEYAFQMPGSVFPRGFDQRSGGFLTTRDIETFNSVAIWPPYGDDDCLRVFFIDNDETWEFSIDSATDERFSLHIPPVSADLPHHVSAVLEGYTDLPPSVFVARVGELGQFASYPVIVTNPYLNHIGETLILTIRNQVAHFFDNPVTIDSRVAADGVFTFSNIHTTMRYFETAVLEYISFRPRRQNVASSFMGDFAAALDFIEADDNVVNELFLAGYEVRRSDHVFWFGYIIGNHPLLMPDGWVVSSPDDILSAPIEVIVDQGRVVYYRRLAYNFNLDYNDHEWVTLEFDNLQGVGNEDITNLRLGYYMRSARYLRLEWWATD